MPAGTLYVVATPLGHLDDLSVRARDTLRSVPLVAAEDTRRIRTLLSHLEAHPKVISFHSHSPERRQSALLDLLAEGRDVALVTDAGTPGVSDPGPALVRAARTAGFTVVPIPGPSAVATALSAGGLTADRFLFLGFLPRKGRDRIDLLRRAVESPETVVLYEAPSRLVDLLADLAAQGGPEREAVVARELTKVHEEIRAGTLDALRTYYDSTPPRGEITVLLAGTGDRQRRTPLPADLAAQAARLLAEGMSRKMAVQQLVTEYRVARNDAYRIVTGLG